MHNAVNSVKDSMAKKVSSASFSVGEACMAPVDNSAVKSSLKDNLNVAMETTTTQAMNTATGKCHKVYADA